jgi:hypothetical protein
MTHFGPLCRHDLDMTGPDLDITRYDLDVLSVLTRDHVASDLLTLRDVATPFVGSDPSPPPYVEAVHAPDGATLPPPYAASLDPPPTYTTINQKTNELCVASKVDGPETGKEEGEKGEEEGRRDEKPPPYRENL